MKWTKKSKKILGISLATSTAIIATPILAFSFVSCAQNPSPIQKLSLQEALDRFQDFLHPEQSYIQLIGAQTVLASSVNSNNFWNTLNMKPKMYSYQFNYQFHVFNQNDTNGSLQFTVTISQKNNSTNSVTSEPYTVSGYLTKQALLTASQSFQTKVINDNQLEILSTSSNQSTLIIPQQLYKNNQLMNVTSIAPNAFKNDKFQGVVFSNTITNIANNAFNNDVQVVRYDCINEPKTNNEKQVIPENIQNAFVSHPVFISSYNETDGLFSQTTYSSDRVNSISKGYQTIFYNYSRFINSATIYGAYPNDTPTGYYLNLPSEYVNPYWIIQPDKTSTLFLNNVKANFASQTLLDEINFNLNARLNHYGNKQKPLVITNAPPGPQVNWADKNPDIYYEKQDGVNIFGKYAVLYTTDGGIWQYCAETYYSFGYVNTAPIWSVDTYGQLMINSNVLNLVQGLYASNNNAQYLAVNPGNVANNPTSNNIEGVPIPWEFLALPMNFEQISPAAAGTNVAVWANIFVYGQANKTSYLNTWNYIYIPRTYTNSLSQLINTTPGGGNSVSGGKILIDNEIGNNAYVNNITNWLKTNGVTTEVISNESNSN